MAFQMPTWTTPFLEPSGMVSKAWYLFLTNLQNVVGGVLPVASGGTGVGSGTSGGILGFTSTTSLKSSVLLPANAIVLGGGAAATPTALGTLGIATQVLHGNAAGAPTFSPVATADITTNAVTNAKLAQMAANSIKLNNTAGLANAIDGTPAQALTLLGIGSPITNSLSGDVALNNVANYFDGPTIAQGTIGTWFVSGTASVQDTAGGADIVAKLWDGTTVIASLAVTLDLINFDVTIPLSGIITSPAGNLRISVRDKSSASGKILFNASGNSMDSTISAFRIA